MAGYVDTIYYTIRGRKFVNDDEKEFRRFTIDVEFSCDTDEDGSEKLEFRRLTIWCKKPGDVDEYLDPGMEQASCRFIYAEFPDGTMDIHIGSNFWIDKIRSFFKYIQSADELVSMYIPFDAILEQIA